MARKRKGRKVNGILLLDKPAGMSSNQALQRVKRLFQAQKAGHTGNLDGPATGLLPICFGEATKMSTFLLDARKSYRSDVRLGIKTTTADAAGEVIESKPVPLFSEQDLEPVLEKFRGTIAQIPPMYSALKHQGERLYKLAVKGIEVERKPRTQEIYRLTASNITLDGFTLEVDCSKGTYIRTLAEDIGAALGCGAHVLTLRRTVVGCFDQERMLTIETLEKLVGDGFEALDKLLLPVDAGLQDMPMISLTVEASFYFQRGQSVRVEGQKSSEISSQISGGLVRVYKGSDVFLGIAECTDEGLIKPKRLIVHD